MDAELHASFLSVAGTGIRRRRRLVRCARSARAPSIRVVHADDRARHAQRSAAGNRLHAEHDAPGDAGRDHVETASSSAPTPTAAAASARCSPRTGTAAERQLALASPAPGTATRTPSGRPRPATDRELSTLEAMLAGQPRQRGLPLRSDRRGHRVEGGQGAPRARGRASTPPLRRLDPASATDAGAQEAPRLGLAAGLQPLATRTRPRSTVEAAEREARRERERRAGLAQRQVRRAGAGRLISGHDAGGRRLQQEPHRLGDVLGPDHLLRGHCSLTKSVIGVSTKAGQSAHDLMPSAQLLVHRLRPADDRGLGRRVDGQPRPRRACRRSTRC